MILAIETFKFIMQLKQKLVANQSAAKCWVESCIKEKCWWHCCKKIVVGWSYILSIWATSCISQQEKITQQEHKFYTQKRVFLLNYFYFLSYFLLLIFSWSGRKDTKVQIEGFHLVPATTICTCMSTKTKIYVGY